MPRVVQIDAAVPNLHPNFAADAKRFDGPALTLE